MIPRSVERLEIASEGGEQAFSTGGEMSLFYFPGLALEAVSDVEPDELTVEVKMRGALWTVSYGPDSTGASRYNIAAGQELISVSRDVQMLVSSLYKLAEDEEIGWSMVGYYCRRVQTELALGGSDDDFDIAIRQTVVAPRADGGQCFEKIHSDTNELWKETVAVGSVERRLRLSESGISLEVSQDLDEFVDLEGEVQPR